MKTNVRVGVIGVGNMGFAHAMCLYKNEVEGLTLAAVCDVVEDRRVCAQKEFPGITVYRDYRDMIDSGLVDAVLIATPHPTHTDIAIQALEADLHVLVEKPLDIRVSKAQRFCEVAKHSKKVSGIMFNQRTNPLFQQARRMIMEGELGELKRTVWIMTNWYRTQHYYDSGDWRATWKGEGGGVLLNQAPHNLDLWQWVCGMPISVRAVCDVGKYHHIEVEDDATLLVRYQNGATGVFLTSTGEFPGTNRLEITGSRGKMVLENSTLKFWQLKQDERLICFESNKSYEQYETTYQEFCVNEPETAHKGILQNFANAILYREELLAPATDGIYQLMLSNGAYLSSWKDGEEIKLPFNTKEFDRLLQERVELSNFQGRESKFTSSSGEYEERWRVRW